MGAARTSAVTAVDGMATAPNALFGSYLLRSAYAGNMLRVRRSNDNAETNVGFTAAGLPDVAAIAAHCTTNNGFLRTLYDQSGNGRDLAQTGVGNQHKIYDGTTGAVTLGTALLALLANDANDYQTRGDGCGLSGLSGGTLWFVGRASAGATTRIPCILGPASVAGDSIEVVCTSLTAIQVGLEGSTRTFTSPDLSTATRSILCSVAAGGAQAGQSTCYVDGVALTESSSVNPSNTSNITGTQTRLGWLTSSWLDKIGAFGVWAGAISAGDRAILESIKAARFG